MACPIRITIVILALSTAGSALAQAISRDEVADRLAARRSGLIFAKVELTYLRFGADAEQVRVLSQYMDGLAAGPVSQHSLAQLVKVLNNAGLAPVAASEGRIVSTAAGYVATWRPSGQFVVKPLTTLPAAGRQPPTTQKRETSATMMREGNRIAIITDRKYVRLADHDSSLDYPTLDRIDPSLFDWLEMKRKGEAPGQTIEVIEGKNHVTLRIGKTGKEAEDHVDYEFDSGREFAPVKVDGVKQLKSKRPGQWLTMRFIVLDQPPYPVMGAIRIQKDAVEERPAVMELYLVHQWQFDRELVLPDVQLPAEYLLLDERDGESSHLESMSIAEGDPATIRELWREFP